MLCQQRQRLLAELPAGRSVAGDRQAERGEDLQPPDELVFLGLRRQRGGGGVRVPVMGKLMAAAERAPPGQLPGTEVLDSSMGSRRVWN
jgi:hypothetical protein